MFQLDRECTNELIILKNIVDRMKCQIYNYLESMNFKLSLLHHRLKKLIGDNDSLASGQSLGVTLLQVTFNYIHGGI